MRLIPIEVEIEDGSHWAAYKDTETGEIVKTIPFYVCEYRDECIKKDCETCERNYPYLEDNYQEYVPTCPKGYSDCVCDPAYMKAHHPEWYKKNYGDMTPEQAAEKYCDPNQEYCYDDEDK